MGLTKQVVQYGRARLMRKMARSMPWIGAIVAVAAVGASMRRKGAIAGVVDTALDAVPFVGAAKNFAEVVRGRDFIPDRATATLATTASLDSRPTARLVRPV
jgi:hypothetical protein